MKSRLSKTVSIVLATMLILSTAMAFTPLAFAVPPAQNPDVYITGPNEPNTKYNFTTDDIGLNEEFTATVQADGVKELFAWQVKCWVNMSVLTISKIKVDPAGPDWNMTMGASYGDDGTYAFGMIAANFLAGTNFTGDCPLCQITFKVVGTPPKLDYLWTLMNITNTDTFLFWTDGSTPLPGLTFYDANYYYYWKLPPTPSIECESYTSPFGENVIGEEVPIDVGIIDLYEAWMVTNFTFDLKYDTSFLDVTGVDATKNETGELFDGIDIKPSVTIDDPGGCVNVTIKLVAPFVDYPNGTGALATITFNITAQNASPGPALTCTLDLVESPTVELTDEDSKVIPLAAVLDGTFTVVAYLLAPPPWFEASDEELGPCYAVGQTIDVEIRLCNVSFVLHLIAYEFRLKYNETLLEPKKVTFGPWLPSFVNATAGELGTFNISIFEPNGMYGPHVLVGAMNLPNMSGVWHPPWPESDETGGLLCTITFEALYQLYGTDIISNLGFFDTDLVDETCSSLVTKPAVNGTYTMKGTGLPGRMIDVYNQYPPGYGGQGQGEPSDMFWPQKEMIICANVTYNCWPVPNKLVTFTVFDNPTSVFTQLEDETDANGVACVSFRMPSGSSLFGLWEVCADVDIGGEIIEDCFEFHFDYLINIVSVTTNKWQYAHLEDVEITVDFTSHAQQDYTTVIRVTVHDDLNVPIGEAYVLLTIGGATFCTAKAYSEGFTIHIPHYAFAGFGTIHAVPRVKFGSDWVAAGPEETGTFFIMPV